MGSFQRTYTDTQRAAIQQAWYERGIRPAPRIVALAAAGELTLDGELVAAFEVKPGSVRDIGERHTRRRERAARDARRLEPKDAVEAFRGRLTAIIDSELTLAEREQRGHKRKPLSTARIAGLARALREVEQVPGPGKQSTGKRPDGVQERGANGRTADGKPSGGMADQLRAAMMPAGFSPVPSENPRINSATGTETTIETSETDSDTTTGTSEGINEERPGAYATVAIAGLRAASVDVEG